jgi:chloramphenicol 3-O phosphotransferase
MIQKLFIALFSLAHTYAGACQIIYLNGTSSVGKTTLAKALQNELTTPYLFIGIDKVIDMMPEKVNNWTGGTAEQGFSWKKSHDADGHPLQLLNIGPFGTKMNLALQEIASTLAKNGFHVIIDDVAMDKDSFANWKTALKGYKVLWVGLTAPLEVIEAREKMRGDRQLGQARAAYSEVHKGYTYDLYFDTSKTSLGEMVQQITARCSE